MGFLRSPSQATQITKYSGLQIQTTSSAIPVPIVYGRNLIAPNVLWYQNFKAWPQKTGGKGGGKGGSSSSATSWTYTADIIMGVCEGPVAAIGYVWQTSTIPTTLAAIGLGFFGGTTPQPVWSYLASIYPTQALTYGGTCYVAAANFSLGSSATISDNNFEVAGILAGSGVNGLDADPAQVVYDFLTNAQYGVGFPAGSISGATLLGNNSASFQAYCGALGLSMSPVLNSQEPATSILARWLQLANSTAIWSGGLLKFIPFGDSAITANGWTFTPNTTPLFSLTDEDFIYAQGEDPIQIIRADAYSLPNWQTVEIQARSDNYNTGPLIAFDQSMIDRFGLRVGSTITAHEICDMTVGQTVAQLMLQRALYIRNTYKFKLGEEFCILEPMDLVQLTDSALGLSATAVRITDIEEDDSGIFTITAEEYPVGVATSVAYPTQAKSNGAPSASISPNQVNIPFIIEPPPALTGNDSQLWIGVSGQSGDPNWGGCIVMASLDGTSYAQVGTIGAPARQGILTANLLAYGGANPDAGNTLAVNLTMSGGSMASSTGAAASQGVTMCYVGGEFLSYTTATLTGANQYNLTGLYRGQAGLPSIGASSGAVFCLLDSSIFKFSIPSAEIGQKIWFKFQSFNIFGDALQDLSTCAAYTKTISGIGSLGPVASALAMGTAMDFGRIAGDTISEIDDYGPVSSAVTTAIDLGNVAS